MAQFKTGRNRVGPGYGDGNGNVGKNYGRSQKVKFEILKHKIFNQMSKK
jgi:hypothetical protein